MKYRSRRLTGGAQAGFTIIELMISSLVFAVVLMVITTGILQIGRVYYRGVTEANTQDVARDITDAVSRAIQFSASSITPTTGTAPGTSFAFCVGDQQFSYRLGWMVVDSTPNVTKHETPHALVVRKGDKCPPQNLSSATVSGQELLSPNMRLARLSVTPVDSLGSAYKVSVKVVHGEDDLLTNPTTADARCKGEAGGQFCSVSELTTTVVRRIE